ncbi:MAG TPA: hypothetical protein VGO22_09200 [Pseudorhizobium sp.]|jgi:hypothetical protein|nr:hypothetical protein [Pseudorhizobium sp.]
MQGSQDAIGEGVVALSGGQRDREHVVGVTGRVGTALWQQMERELGRSSPGRLRANASVTAANTRTKTG